MISHYLIDIIILLISAVIIVPVAQVTKIGALPGFLIAGVIVGPYGLALITKVNEIAHFSEIGVVFLLFIIGIEQKPSRLWQMRRLVFGLGTLQVIITGIVLGIIGAVVFDMPVRVSVIVGPTLALSSTAFVLQLLSEQKLLSSIYGRTSFSILLLQDLAIVPLLALMPLLATPELNIGSDIGLALLESAFILGLVILIGRYFLHPFLHRIALSGSDEIFTALSVLIILGTAIVTEHIRLSMAMGAFLAGLLISNSFYRHQIIAEIQPFRGLLLGLFFISMGMSINLNLLLENPLYSLGMVCGLIAIKVLVLYPTVYWFGIQKKNALAIALVLAQSGEFALVLFSLAFQSNMLNQQLFQELILAVLLSMIITPILAYFAQRLVKNQDTESKGELLNEIPVESPIVLAGFGRVGHRVGEILSLAGKSFVALDSNADIVEKERANGHPVFYGDVRKPKLLQSVGAKDARLLIVTLNDAHATEEVVASLRKMYPKIKIYARGHDSTQCRELLRLGASGVISENVEASLELARLILRHTDMSKKEQKAVLENFRRRYHQQINHLV